MKVRYKVTFTVDGESTCATTDKLVKAIMKIESDDIKYLIHPHVVRVKV